MQQILRAHQIFLLHQAPTIADLFARVSRQKFCGFLKRFWDGFISSWDVLLHGNPGVDTYNGLKLAAGGELGIGVGEEEWGSGEREVLEGFIGRTEGLFDLVVSRFGDSHRQGQSTYGSPNSAAIVPGSGEYPGPSDGVIFSGIGALTRPSIRNVSSWVDWLDMYGEDAYGVRENPSSSPRFKRRKKSEKRYPPDVETSRGGPDIPAPIVSLASIHKNSLTPQYKSSDDSKNKIKTDDAASDDTVTGTQILMRYVTLGVYGSSWGIPAGRPPVDRRISSLRIEGNVQGAAGRSGSQREQDEPKGYFLIGLQGELEEDSVPEVDDGQDSEGGTDRENFKEEKSYSSRLIMRTLYVERTRAQPPDSNTISDPKNENINKVFFDRLRVVVYIQRPFIFTFLFDLQTDSLNLPSFYRSLHHQLGPLLRPLLSSTSPSKVSSRLYEAAAPKSTAAHGSSQPICDLVYDPARLTVHTTIPNIPESGPTPADCSTSFLWTRVEALSVHSQILNTHTSTRRHISELERTCKTSRGWWVVWIRLPHSPITTQSSMYREAFLIRKASDYVVPAARNTSEKFRRDVGGSGSGVGWSAGKLAEGIGIDARQYIEGLLSLNR